VATVVDDAPHEFPAAIPATDHADSRVYGSSGTHDVRIALSGMSPRLPVLHPKPPVERDAFLMAYTGARAEVGTCRIGRHDRVHNAFAHPLNVDWVIERGVVVGQLSYQLRRPIVLARLNSADRSSRVRVRCTDEDAGRSNAATPGDFFPALLHERSRDGACVHPHERYPVGPIAEDRGTCLARIMERPVIRLSIAAGLLHSDVRGDVAFRITGTRRARLSR
jgi:hypothetical protein